MRSWRGEPRRIRTDALKSVSLTSVIDCGVSLPRRTENEPDCLLPAQGRVSRRGSNPSSQHVQSRTMQEGPRRRQSVGLHLTRSAAAGEGDRPRRLTENVIGRGCLNQDWLKDQLGGKLKSAEGAESTDG
jgi:hypothetical protein